MVIDRAFRFFSYGVAYCAAFSLVVADRISWWVTIPFLLALTLAYFLEGTRLQLSERLGTIAVFCVVPMVLIDWRYGFFGFNELSDELPARLAKLILFLALIKFFQRKSDRDWVFIYLISFFQILLAAGLTISPIFFVVLISYIFFSLCAIVTFEIVRAEKSLRSDGVTVETANTRSRTLPRLSLLVFGTSALILIATIALPVFIALPRVGGAGMGSSFGSGATLTGFSDLVRLGEIGKIQRNEEIVFRARLSDLEAVKSNELRWRGVALDFFDGKSWRSTKRNGVQQVIRNDNNFFSLGAAHQFGTRVTQTIYLEPISTDVLFVLAQPLAVRGNFSILTRDREDSFSRFPTNGDRMSYTVLSEFYARDPNLLRRDFSQLPSTFDRYLQLNEGFDERIALLGTQIAKDSGAKNSFDYSVAVESYLRRSYGYTLDLKAGGDSPVSDFLFNVREGHCEYFASAMAMILRSKGIPTRIVNGFQSGDYNDAAGVYVVRQSDAHSWVEVYFPEEDVWVPFDPTPSASDSSSINDSATISGKIDKYWVALETFWIQYFVTFDNYEQRSLFRSIRNGAFELQETVSNLLTAIKLRFAEWWKQARGDEGLTTSLLAIVRGLIYLIAFGLSLTLAWLTFRRIRKLKIFEAFLSLFKRQKSQNAVAFYERLERLLARRGFTRAPHQTPLEFAYATNVREAVSITENYNRVRFGEKDLSEREQNEIETWLRSLEAEKKNG